MTRLTSSPLSRLSAGHWIGAASGSHAHRACFVEGAGAARTYAEVNRRVNRLARAFSARGLRKGDRLAILATDSIEHVEVVLACLATGVVFCDLNIRLRPGELANIVEMAEPAWIAAGSRYIELAVELSSVVAPRPVVIGLGGGTFPVGTVSDLIDGEVDDRPVDVVAHGEDIASIAFTSGTTGTPKGVLQSERMIRSMVYSCIYEARVRAGSFRYNGPPLFHFAGIGATLYGMVAGATTLLLPQFDSATVLHWMQHGGVTDTLLVPTMLSALLEEPTVGGSSYDSLRTILYGGAPMSTALLRRVVDTFGCDLINLFGAGTEAGGQATLHPEDHLSALAGRPELLESVGRVIPGVQVRLVDPDLVDVAAGEYGELLVRTETSMSGYLGQPELTAMTVVDGWLRTGDVARMDDDGYLYLASRRSETIIRGGENVYPDEIETVLALHVAVAVAVAVGLADAHWGEVVVGAVTLRPGAAVDTEELVVHCSRALASYKVPCDVVIVDAIPLTASGKVDRAAVRTLVAECLAGRSVDISDSG